LEDYDVLVDEDDCIAVALSHITEQLKEAITVVDGWAEGLYVTRPHEPVCTVILPRQPAGVGASRAIVVSKETGEIISDTFLGE
jgi:hypothetical protein